MKHIYFSVAIYLSVFTVLADFTLVRDGKPETVIEIDEKPVASVQMAAFELQHHIKLITGAELPIVAEAPVTAKRVIRLGGGNQDFAGERHVRKFLGKVLHITGTDSADYRKVDYRNAATFPSYTQAYNGTLYGVYDFLEDLCGVRFYWMDETGTVYDRCRTLAVKEIDRDFVPPMDAFREVYDDDRNLSRFQVSDRDRALWRFRWRMTSFFGRTNHNQYSIYFKYWDKAENPQLAKAFIEKREALFAQGFKGKSHGVDPILRTNFPLDYDLPPQLCYSNPDTVKYYADEVLTYFRGGNVPGGWLNFDGRHPENRTLLHRFPSEPFFYPIQGGDTGGHCLCANCKKRFPDDDKDDVSNNKFCFIAEVARETARTDPAAGVSTLAYIQTLGYPTQVVLPPNVSVQLCLTIYSWWHPMSEKFQMAAYKKWIELEAEKRPLTLWTYIFSTYWDSRFHFGNYKPFPGLYPWKTGELFKMFARDGIRGWFTEVEMQYNHLEAYVAQKICYDPSLEPAGILDEYFERCYGEAGAAMKEFYREIQEAYWNPANCPAAWLKNTEAVIGPRGVKHPYWGTGLHSPDVNWALGTPQRMEKLDNLIRQAQKLVKTREEKERLRRIIDGIWINTLEGQREYRQWQMKRENPPRSEKVASIPAAYGDFSKIDWTQGTKTAELVTVDGKAAPHAGQAVFAADAEYLYIKYTDRSNPNRMENIWKENLELFFAADRKYPVLHFTFSPGGNTQSYRHEFINDAGKITPCDFGIKSAQDIGNNSWEVLLALPRQILPVAADGSLIFNLCRTDPEDSTVWTPIYTAGYIDGLAFFGKLRLFPVAIKPEAMNFYKKGVCSDLVPEPAAPGGSAAMMQANSGWSLQYRFPEDFTDGSPYQVKIMFKAVLPEKAPENMRSQIGIYHPASKKTVAFTWVPAESPEKGYREIVLPATVIPEGSFLYLGGLSAPCPGAKFFCSGLSVGQ